MSQEIQPYTGADLRGELGPADVQMRQPDAISITPIMEILRRRWQIILLLWVLLVGIGVPSLWLIVKRVYTASAHVHISPDKLTILYHDENSRAMSRFDAYLYTQAQLISSHQVLTSALADPSIRDCSIVQEKDPVAALREILSVEPVRRTNLIQISIEHQNAEEAVRLTKAMVEAYMGRVVGAEEAEQRKKLGVLEDHREDLRAKLKQIRSEVQKLAEEYSTVSDSMFELLRESVVQSSLETKKELERVELEILQLGEKIKQLVKGVITVILTEEELATRKDAIENDPIVRSLKEELLIASSRLIKLKSTLTEEHLEVIRAQNNIKWLHDQLKKERIRAANDIEKEFVEQREQSINDAKTRLKLLLEAARQHKDILLKRVGRDEDKGMAIGRRALEIQVLQQEADTIQQRFDRVNEEIKKVEIERYRPARVKIASGAEIRPDGVKDHRKKLTIVIIVGSLFAAIAVALLQDRKGSRLHAPRQIEEGMGLPVLGIVPCLRELKSGLVTKEDFIESYRIIRATLSAIGNEGLPPKSILVTSGQASEGKTSLALSLATSLAEPGGRVLLVDGDIQSPQIGRLLKLWPTGNLETVLLGKLTLAKSVAKSTLPGLDVLTCSQNGSNISRIFNNQAAYTFLKEAIETYNHIVIDSSPVLSSADTLIWAHVVDGVIISSLASQSNTVTMRLTCERLISVGAKVLGSVIGNVSRKEGFQSYSTSSYRSKSSGPGGDKSGEQQDHYPIVYLTEDDVHSQ